MLLLISEDFIASDYIMGNELGLAMARQQRGESTVVPILLRPVDLQPEDAQDMPFVNLLMIPLGLVGAVAAVSARALPNDIYLQIGLLTTVGLSTKNAILIIQFIKDRMAEGHDAVEATLEAVRIRLRPVIMTSLAFFFGTLPLALATGAGAAAQKAIGTAVTGGLLSATFIDLIFIPFFFVLVSKWFGARRAVS